jgi:hypothetical protein
MTFNSIEPSMTAAASEYVRSLSVESLKNVAGMAKADRVFACPSPLRDSRDRPRDIIRSLHAGVTATEEVVESGLHTRLGSGFIFLSKGRISSLATGVVT